MISIIKELKKDIKFSIKVLIVCAVLLAILPTFTAAAVPKVIMTFDDGWLSVYDKAYPIMNAHGQAGVAFVYPAIIGVGTDFMTIPQLNTLYGSGWDISSHTYNHTNLTNVSSVILNNELSKSRAWLNAAGFTRSSMLLAYPEGQYNPAVITAVKTNQYLAARTVLPPTDYAQYTLNSGDIIFELRSFETVGGTENGTDVAVINEINTTIAKGGLLILSFHKIVDTFSSTPETEFKTSDFQNVSDYLASRTAEIDVVSLSNYFGIIAPPQTPGQPIITATKGNFWINWTYQAGINTNDLQVLINGTDVQQSISNYYNATNLAPHSTMNISVRGHNQVNNTYSNWTNDTQTLTNNQVTMQGIFAVNSVLAGTNISIIPTVSDLDNDTITFTTNATKGSINNTTGVFILNTSAGDQGTYNWSITANDGHGSAHSINFTVIIGSPVQTPPFLSMTKNNFWINWTYPAVWINSTYQAGMNSDDFIVLINGMEVQHNATTSYNATNLTPHATLNISVRGHNHTSDTYSKWTNGTQTLTNNKVTMQGILAVNSVLAGTNISIIPTVSDLDNDTIAFTTNATKGSINNTTGVFILNSSPGDQGTYNWSITANDGHGSAHSINFTVIIESPVQTPLFLSMTKDNFWINWTYPAIWINETYQAGMNSDDFIVLINGMEVQHNVSTTYNATNITPHTTLNISVRGHNHTSDTYSEWTNDTQTMDNNPVSTGLQNAESIYSIWAEYSVYAGDSLRITPISLDLDNDTLSFTTNATGASINNLTGEFILNATAEDKGSHVWNISVNDGHGSAETVNFTVDISIKTDQKKYYSVESNSAGGGGGGANMFDPNTESYEQRDSQILKDIESKVGFVNNKLVSKVTFHGRRNYGEATVTASILKDNPTPKYIANAYKFFAIRLDSIREQEEKLYISNSTVTVHVDMTKLSDNNLKAYRFINDTWIPVVLEELQIEDGSSKYYNLESDGLSNFVIVLEPKPPTTIEPEEPQLSTMASIIPHIETSPSEMVSKIQESLYRVIINWIKKHMWWI
ncbi:MAG: polysaccharide deacetylase family protein [Candidatus Methanoperedens sp.]|nr:polysaccharide deacetylase family protein [Candidatus Methanoperedens sp.]